MEQNADKQNQKKRKPLGLNLTTLLPVQLPVVKAIILHEPHDSVLATLKMSPKSQNRARHGRGNPCRTTLVNFPLVDGFLKFRDVNSDTFNLNLKCPHVLNDYSLVNHLSKNRVSVLFGRDGYNLSDQSLVGQPSHPGLDKNNVELPNHELLKTQTKRKMPLCPARAFKWC